MMTFFSAISPLPCLPPSLPDGVDRANPSLIRKRGLVAVDDTPEFDRGDIHERQAWVPLVNEAGARRELAAILDSLDNDQTLAIVRAFSYFSHLANIAEDQHHTRRNRAHVRRRSAPRPGSLRHTFRRAREAGLGT